MSHSTGFLTMHDSWTIIHKFIHYKKIKNIYHSYPTFLPVKKYRGADKSLAQPTSLCIVFDVENISFDASLVMNI